MNETMKDELINKRNMLYYNQLNESSLQEDVGEQESTPTPKKRRSFGSQKVDFKDFFYVPEQFAAAFYVLYGVGIPYIFGAVFLFFVVAGGSYENFKLLNLHAFFVIWLIGYEIVTVLALVWIVVLYLKYDPDKGEY